MKVIMAAGGTGGHIYPAIAIANELKSRYNAEIIFIGQKNRLEATLVPKAGYKIEFIRSGVVYRNNPIKNIRSVFRLTKAILRSKKIIRDFKPDIVIGTGGYISAPTVMAAQQLGIKTAIHEIAHAILHSLPEQGEDGAIVDDRPNRKTKEVQAESVAYTVCQRFGIETSDYSFGYIAGWSSGQETKELKASLELIRETASDIIEKIEEKMPELTQEKKKVQQVDKPFDLHKTVDYIKGIASKIAIAENDDLGQKTFKIALKQFGKLANTLPTEEVGLKELCDFVSTSETLESMQERVNEVMNYLGYELNPELKEPEKEPVPEVDKDEVKKEPKKEKKTSVRKKLKEEKDKIAKETPKAKTKSKSKTKAAEAEVS